MASLDVNLYGIVNNNACQYIGRYGNSNMAQRKTIIQTQFVSVVSKVISDDIFNERF